MEMEEARQSKRQKIGNSCLASALTKMWGLGLLSARNVQHLASCGISDGVQDERLQLLAALGTFGSHPNNCHRDLMRSICKTMALQGSLVTVPALDTKADPPQVSIPTKWLPPHILVADLVRNYPQHMDDIFGFSKAKRFWHGIKPNDPRLYGSPVKAALDEDASLVVPLFLHGDGVEYTGSDSLLAFSFGSILGNSGLKQSQECHLEQSLSSFDKCFLIASFPKSATSDSTWEELLKGIVWSLNALWEGVFPKVDQYGHKVSCKWGNMCGETIIPNKKVRFIVWSYLGDLEYFANCLKYPHWNSPSFCPWCNASRNLEDKFVYDFSENHGWQMHSLEHQFEHPASKHPLVNQVPGSCPAYRILFDGLHTIELGLVARLAGSTLHGLCYCGGLGTQPHTNKASEAQKNLDRFWNMLKKAYKELGEEERLNNLKLTMFHNPKKAFQGPFILKAHAGELKHLVPAMALALQWVSKDSSAQWILHAGQAFLQLSQYYGAIDAGDIHLSDALAQEAFQSMKATLQHYGWLNQNFPFHRDLEVYFQLFPKLHFCHHIGWFARYQNPRTSWCYYNESWIGSLAVLAHSCSHGTRSAKLAMSLTKKYLCALHMRLTRAS